MSPKNEKLFDILRKKNIREWNTAEVHGHIIEQFLNVEDLIDDLILDFVKPSKPDTFKKVFLNSSIVTIGAKVKIIANYGVDNKILDKIRRLTNIRNGFSHSRIHGNIRIILGEVNSDKSREITTEAESVISVMNSNGKLETKNAHDLLQEFIDTKNELVVLLKAILPKEVIKEAPKRREVPPVE
ncbi:hypothetical protein [Aegicerativicinus sediminis]|uniref:hypothetical protein n=1 Tax=Aegicerativicinus sediminis TaxID=2893202 RepID=UPI001E4BD47A|nr:hypothetical protein [Aegicerativicinus sediminis]